MESNFNNSRAEGEAFARLALKVIQTAVQDGRVDFFNSVWYKEVLLPLAQRVYLFDPEKYKQEAQRKKEL